MSIIIKGLEMPESCATCTLQQETKCGVNYKWLLKHPDYYNARRPDCPLVEIPTPHGRLIDFDALDEKINISSWQPLAPTILEAEE